MWLVIGVFLAIGGWFSWKHWTTLRHYISRVVREVQASINPDAAHHRDEPSGSHFDMIMSGSNHIGDPSYSMPDPMRRRAGHLHMYAQVSAPQPSAAPQMAVSHHMPAALRRKHAAGQGPAHARPPLPAELHAIPAQPAAWAAAASAPPGVQNAPAGAPVVPYMPPVQPGPPQQVSPMVPANAGARLPAAGDPAEQQQHSAVMKHQNAVYVHARPPAQASSSAPPIPAAAHSSPLREALPSSATPAPSSPPAPAADPGPSPAESAVQSEAPDIPASTILWDRQIGTGGCGAVWAGRWHGTPVAIKVLHTANAKDEFWHEVGLLSKLHHPHIVQCLGVVRTARAPALVMELVPNGSLWDVLHAAPGQPDLATAPASWVIPSAQTATAVIQAWSPTTPGALPIPLVISMALDIARGMAYLHSQSPPIILRDLKSPNVLVGAGWHLKITDLGISRVVNPGVSMTRGACTLQWAAPEVVTGTRYDERADVYSFGIVLWELLTRRCPYEGQDGMAAAMASAMRGERPPIPAGTPASLVHCMTACWAADPAARPGFPHLIQVLSQLAG